MPFFELFFWLLVGHSLADFALQNDYVARAKNPHDSLGIGVWPMVLGAHALIHGGMVAYATGMIWLGVAETICHFGIDYAKCTGKLGQHPRSYQRDQALHVACKVVWAMLAIALGSQ